MYTVFDEELNSTVGVTFATLRQAMTFMCVFDPDGTIPLMIKHEDEVVPIEEIMLECREYIERSKQSTSEERGRWRTDGF